MNIRALIDYELLPKTQQQTLLLNVHEASEDVASHRKAQRRIPTGPGLGAS
ncbi:hypothetical protein [Streptomyces ramulosus]|uniref:Transposase n=1 Tax=Streptomyces ramulosus TaxID=47762 RepID=A0ABW1FCA8_9ACTN